MEIGGGFTHRMAEYTASRTAANAVQQHVPAKFGGRKPAGEGDSGLGAKLQTAAKMAGFAAATGGVGAAPAAGSAAAGGAANAKAAGTAARTAPSSGGKAGARGASNPRAYAPPPSAAARDRGVGLAPNGLQTPSFRQVDFNNEMFEADRRSRSKANPVTVAQARSALASLPADTQKGVGHLVAEHGKEARQHLAYQATGEWLPGERDALRTLAAATPEVREQALAEAEKGGWVTGDTTVYEGTLEDTPPAEPTSNNGNGGAGSADDPVDTVFNERDQVYEVPSASSGSGPGAARPSDGTPGDGPSFTGLDRSAAPKGPAPPPGSGRPTPRAIEAPRNQPPSRGD
jgi:hypothetical protein